MARHDCRRVGGLSPHSDSYNASTNSTVRVEPVEVLSVEDFRIAVMKNDIVCVQRLLEAGINVDTTFTSGWTALMYAASYAMQDCIACLLDYKASANAHKDCYTALMCACASTKCSEPVILECVCQLLDAGSDVNLYDKYGMSALMYAAREGHSAIVKKLIEVNGYMDRQDNKGFTALMWAVQRGHLKVVDVLVSLGADVKRERRDKTNALDLARQGTNQQIINILSKAFGLDTQEHLAVSQLTAQTESNPLPVKPTISSVSGSSDTYAQCVASATAPPRKGFELPVEEKISRPLSPRNTRQEPMSICSELELFLRGLDLASLIPLFNSQNVSFKTFLSMSDADLYQIGVFDTDARSKMLEAVHVMHLQPWQVATLADVSYKKKITCNEAAAMLLNIKQHIAYIVSMVGFVSDQIVADRQIVLNASGSTVEDLVANTEQASQAVSQLFNQLVQLRLHIGKINGLEEYKAPDLTQPRKTRKITRRRKLVLLFAGCCGVLGVLTVVFTSR